MNDTQVELSKKLTLIDLKNEALSEVRLQCCSVLQFVAVCYSVLQCVAVCCSALQCDAEQCVAVCCSLLQ